MAGDLKDRRWLDESERRQNVTHIIEVLEKWARTHTVNELVETGQLMRFPWAGVASIADVVNSPQLSDRGFFAEAVEPETGKRYPVPGEPVKMSASPWKVNLRIPLPGEFNQEVFITRLGLKEMTLKIAKSQVVQARRRSECIVRISCNVDISLRSMPEL